MKILLKAIIIKGRVVPGGNRITVLASKEIMFFVKMCQLLMK